MADRIYIVFDNMERAYAFRDRVDDAHGLPKQGVRVGGGIHAPKHMGWTVTQALLLKHPGGRAWAYPVDSVPPSLLTGDVLQGKAPTQLGHDWQGAIEVPPDLGRLPDDARSYYAQFYGVDVPPTATFDLDARLDGATIVEVGGQVGAELLRYFSQHPEEMRVMDRRLFEELVAEIFRRFNYEVEVTKRTRDGGRDVIAIKHSEVRVKYLIECKRPDPGGRIGIGTVRELYGVKTDERATLGVLVTTGRITRDALAFVERHQWELDARDYDGVLAWLRQSNTG